MDLLHLFHSVLMAGSLSKYGWAKGLREFLSHKAHRRIPDLKKVWEYAYFNWLQFDDQKRRIMERRISDTGIQLFARDSFADLCPACFNRGANDFGACVFSIDGNFQHKRFHFRQKRSIPSSNQERYNTSAMFVSVVGNDRDGNEMLESRRYGCSHSFVAAENTPKPETMKGLDETGLMEAVCRHGHPLRYLNLYAGE